MSNIVVIGSSNTDMVIKSDRIPVQGETVLGGEFFMNPGGKGANQAVAAAKLGGRVSFVGRVGDDVFGKQALEGLKAEGIDTKYVTIDDSAASGTALILVDKNAENLIAVASGANANLSVADVDNGETSIRECSVLLMQLEIPIPCIERAIELGKRYGKTIILNPAPAASLPDSMLANVDVITPNETEAEILTGIRVTTDEDAEQAARALKDLGIGIVLITLGAKGVYVLSDDFCGIVTTRKVEALDTTAAGDTFNGALAVALAKGCDLKQSVAFANHAASISVTRMGAQSSCPTLEEVS